MPFKPGHVPANKGKKKTDVVVANEVVIEELPVSAVETDEIIPKAPLKPVQEKKEAVIPTTADDDSPDFSGIHGWNMAELELYDVSLNRVPNPPKCVMEWCRARNLRWRWLSYPAVKNAGMRGHVALSVTPELRKKIRRGDCPATVDIDVTNKLVWREDAFLGVIPIRLAELQKAAIRQRTLDQTKLASQGVSDGLREIAARAGGKIVDFSVEESSRQGM